MTDYGLYNNMMNKYSEHETDRRSSGIPPLPINPELAEALCNLLLSDLKGNADGILELITSRIAPGVDPAAKVKAEFLGKILNKEKKSKYISRTEAIRLLAGMMGGFNVRYLIKALTDEEVGPQAAEALTNITLIYDSLEEVVSLAEKNPNARRVVESWAAAEWFSRRPQLPADISLKVFRVDGETNTDDLSPASDAWSRPDIPLHALSMGVSRFPDGKETIFNWRKAGFKVAFVGDVVGTGSSRKSATNSVLWHIGDDIPGVPNKRRGGVVLGGVIAPIFFNTVLDSGGLPIITDVTSLKMADEITIRTRERVICNAEGKKIAAFDIQPATLPDDFRAGGRIPMIVGRSLTEASRKALGMGKTDLFIQPDNPVPEANQSYSQAQKIVGKACGLPGILPGTSCEAKMTTVLSQDTTGPMTADELKELACLKFQNTFFLQSFCHTAAYPKQADVNMHRELPPFIVARKGIALRPGDGVCHSWINRMLLPDTLGTGGDSHTRFPLGLSFPAGSGLVAFAGALGFMPLDMPESVLVKFKGRLQPGLTLRDVVNAIPLTAIREGLLTVPKKNKKNVFNGRIIEMTGLPHISVEEAFELTDATAERSAAAGCINLSRESVSAFLNSNVAFMKGLIENGYRDAETLETRIREMEQWLREPALFEADPGARYAAQIEVDLSEIREPIVACPNDPDDVKPISEVEGTAVDVVFIGSCMTNIGHFRAAAKIWEGQRPNPKTITTICPPTRMDQAKLKSEALFSIFNQMNARIEIPGCSLCMGNQQRVPDEATVFSTSTRNFDNRMGTGARVFLGSAELAAVTAIHGKIPSAGEYLNLFNERVKPHLAEIYSYLQFDKT